MDFLQEFSDPELCRALVAQLVEECTEPFRFMEVCGTHTVAIFRSGLRSLLPDTIIHVSGPGCPVCVTHESEVELYLEMACRRDTVTATFGDLMKVPGAGGSCLKTAQAEGAHVEIVYSPFDALALARKYPDKKVVFLGIGFETTAPTIAATIKMAREQKIDNFLVLSFHKLVPPALRALLDDPEIGVDGFLLPGHVSTIIGLEPYRFLADDYGIPGAVAGFDPLDVLKGLLAIVRMKNEGKPAVTNEYRRAVSDQGNPTAVAIMEEVFEPADALWRGIGSIPGSGLVFREDWKDFDAAAVLGLEQKPAKPLPGCKCGDVLKGKIRPDECPLFKKRCTPATPVGPCMVSTEGSCAAYFKYHIES
ncbi:hydrogenase formation protein HypD [Oceanidesulfovibrio marinus]|uniref:Hydrogenase formation protein HypD n=1 Tax=Oceanidesulfovibrio marinus TaxID=370038 RepID=A0ABX6NJH6_9BACT|nr:hydrogenase formation protein HypD [Oceanidesulfovibrio marinus]QJT09882.1 hydrogenase formation protein HypD [Oceanidesulfovibrio marinus]